LKAVILGVLVSVFAWYGSGLAVEIVFDGDDSDWADIPALITDPDDQEGQYPADQAVLWTDIVDVKEVKFFVQGNEAYYLIRFWGAPAWPNAAYPDKPEGANSRGYYHILVDLDNDVSTGWDTGWYEGHITNLGPNLKNIGAEQYLELGLRTDKPQEEDWSRLEYYAEDVSGYDAQSDAGDTFDMYEFPPDGTPADAIDPQLLFGSYTDPETSGSFAHAWGPDFVEVKHSLLPSIIYWQGKGFDYWKPGDTISIACFVETPIDDWGNDFTDGAEYTLPTTAAEGSSWGSIKAMFR